MGFKKRPQKAEAKRLQKAGEPTCPSAPLGCRLCDRPVDLSGLRSGSGWKEVRGGWAQVAAAVGHGAQVVAATCAKHGVDGPWMVRFVELHSAALAEHGVDALKLARFAARRRSEHAVVIVQSAERDTLTGQIWALVESAEFAGHDIRTADYLAGLRDDHLYR